MLVGRRTTSGSSPKLLSGSDQSRPPPKSWRCSQRHSRQGNSHDLLHVLFHSCCTLLSELQNVQFQTVGIVVSWKLLVSYNFFGQHCHFWAKLQLLLLFFVLQNCNVFWTNSKCFRHNFKRLFRTAKFCNSDLVDRGRYNHLHHPVDTKQSLRQL